MKQFVALYNIKDMIFEKFESCNQRSIAISYLLESIQTRITTVSTDLTYSRPLPVRNLEALA